MKQLQEKILLEEPVQDITMSNVPEVNELPAVEITEPVVVTDTELEDAIVEPEVEENAFVSLLTDEISNNYSSIDNYKSIKVTLDSSDLDEATKESVDKIIEDIIDNKTIEIGMLQTALEQINPDMIKLIDDGAEYADSVVENK